MNKLALLVLLFAAPAWGQFQFPEVAPPIAPPMPPGTVPVLPPKVLYTVFNPQPFFARLAPGGLATVTMRNGPITIYGTFIEDPTKATYRDFPAGQVALIEAVSTGRVEVILIPAGVTKDIDIVSRLIDCLVGPIPPPGPDPKPPDPSPKPPIPVAGFRTLVVYESGDLSTLPPSQLSVLYSKSVRDYLNAKCVVGPDGKTKEFRFWDNDVDTSGESALWQAAMKRPRSSLPWIVISNGTSGFEGPLPGTIDETLSLLKKYAEPQARK